MIDDDMRAVIAAQRLCYAATVAPDGRPNLSPKGTIRVWDDHHLLFYDIASPGTRANLAVNPWIEINVVDPLSRRGYRFRGTATVHAGDAVYRDALARLAAEQRVSYAVHAVVLVRVERALPIASPAYERVPDEATMRELWRARRAGLEAEFEQHLARRGPWRPEWAR
ncbi:MAG TPA: pyridoxamine 5'-phosphate oxidase family protein [Candidatus Dormibacteraeota bacterium]|nr:pyridoxamine 5'-phosphate oxidase family protein [Candidatus Dormibacteraeota bacterium]